MPRQYPVPVNTIQLSIRLDPETNEILRRVAFQGRISVTEAARRILVGALVPKKPEAQPLPPVVPDASGNVGAAMLGGTPCPCEQCTAARKALDAARGSPS